MTNMLHYRYYLRNKFLRILTSAFLNLTAVKLKSSAINRLVKLWAPNGKRNFAFHDFYYCIFLQQYHLHSLAI